MTDPAPSTDLIPRTQSGQIRRLTAQEIALNAGQGALNVFENQFFTPFGATWDERSLTLPNGMKFEQWSSLVALLLQHRERLPFHIADALTYGEAQYGVSYAQAVEMSGQSSRVLGQLQSIAKVAPKNRKAKLSEDHHIAVAHETDKVQQVILELAAENSWSVEATREQVTQNRSRAANLMPQASLVPPPVVTVGEVRVRMTREAFVVAGKAHLSREDLAWAVVRLDNYVRGGAAGEVWMDADIPTSAVYAGMDEGMDDGRDAGCTELVPISLVREPVKPLPVEPYQEPLTEDRTWRLTDEEAIAKLSASGRVTAYLEIAGRATNPQMAEAMRLSKRTIDGATKSLSESGRIIRTGEVDTTSTSSTPPAYWALPGRGQEVIEGEWQNAQEAA